MSSMSSTAAAGLFASLLALAGCDTVDSETSLEHTLFDASGSAEIVISDLVPSATKAAIVCPYSGFKANEAFGRKVFKDFEDTRERSNWFMWKSGNGATVKEELYMEQVDMCLEGSPVRGFRELTPENTLVFKQVNSAWRLTEIR